MATATWVVGAFPPGARVLQRGWRDTANYLSPAIRLSPHKMPLGVGSWHEADHVQGI